MAERTCPDCGLRGRWHHADGCGPCRKLRRPVVKLTPAEAWAARWAALVASRWVAGADGLLYPRTGEKRGV